MKMRIQAIRLGVLGYFGIIEYFFLAALLAFTGAAYLPGWEIATISMNRVILSGLNVLGWVALMVVAMLEKWQRGSVRTIPPSKARSLNEVIEELRITGEREAREAQAQNHT